MKGGSAFLQLDKKEKKPHLWVIISDPEQDADRVLLVNFTTWDNGPDPACIIQAGDHEFVHHPTCVFYQLAEVTSLVKLEEKAQNGFLQPYGPVSPPLLARIRQGAWDSEFIAWEHLDLLEAQGIDSGVNKP